MKQVLLMLASLVLAAVVSMATYNDTLNGSQTAAPEAEGIALNLTANGDLPGMSKVNLQRNSQNVTGGNFRLTVTPQNADASSNERGAPDWNDQQRHAHAQCGRHARVSLRVQVTIQSGTGEFASVTSGTATLTITANAENPSQLNGTLALNF